MDSATSLGSAFLRAPLVALQTIAAPVRHVIAGSEESELRKSALRLPGFGGDEDETSADRSGDGSLTSDTSWEMLPGEDRSGDPRFDRHGFRRNAARIEHEEAFESAYAGRLLQQEQRWSRKADQQREGTELSHGELKRLARLGIPVARRKAVWPQLCRAAELKAAAPDGYFLALLALPAATAPTDAGFAAERQIDLDLARTFPGHRLLSSADGAARLREVLVAYARRDPRVGYVQGMGFVAALLLVFVEDTEEAFWCLASVIEWLLPEDYYNATLLGLRTEQSIFGELVALRLPRIAAHFERHGCVVELFATRWFVALYANALPVETTLRVWDAFLLEGIKVIHRIGLALLRISEDRLLACNDQQELLMTLQEEHAHCLDCDRLLLVAFDRISFLRSFPQSRIDALRRKHRARLTAAEVDSGWGDGPTTDSAAITSPLTDGVVVPPRPPLRDDPRGGDSSSEDDLEEESNGAPSGSGFDVVSAIDDTLRPVSSFWL